MRSGKQTPRDLQPGTCPITIHLVAHTHWDREWYQPFQVSRTRLVEMMDALLDLMERKEQLRYFTLDGQSVMLEDYLQVRAGSEERLRKLVHDGRIFVGPWYVASDEFLVSPESLIRNLLLGQTVARRFGEPMDVGYLPDTFGHVSTMPLLLMGFGIQSTYFGRGRRGSKQQFLWASRDGSRVLAINQPYVTLTLRPHKGRGVKAACESLPRDAGELHDLIREKVGDWILTSAVPDNLLAMSGIDHGPAPGDLSQMIAECNLLLGRDGEDPFRRCHLIESNLENYVAAIASSTDALEIEQGELRQDGHDNFSGTLSSRTYLKLGNHLCECELERWAEPFSAMAWVLGEAYPRGVLQEAWRELLLNHAHDSICGCSIDEVHLDMVARSRASQQMAERTTGTALARIAQRIDTTRQGNPALALVVFNPLTVTRDEVVETHFDIPLDVLGAEVSHLGLSHQEALDSLPSADCLFTLEDFQGVTVPTEVLSLDVVDDFIYRGCGAPDFGSVIRYHIAFEAKGLPPLGYETFYLTRRPGGIGPTEGKGVVWSSREAENDFLILTIEDDGTVTLVHKPSGGVFRNLNLFEDRGDVGDEYNYSPCSNDVPVLSSHFPSETSLVRAGPLEVIFRVRVELQVPSQAAADRRSRGPDLSGMPIDTYLFLRKGSPRLDIRTVVENTARDHRFRVLFPVRISGGDVYAGGHFDTLRRPAVDATRGGLDSTFPLRDFVFVQRQGGTLALFCNGLAEYEAVSTPREAIALTLIRATGWMSRSDLTTRQGNCGYEIETPGAQCLGPQEFHYSVQPLSEKADLEMVHRYASVYINGPRSICASIHKGELPRAKSFVEASPECLVLSAVKKSETRDSLVLRFFNPSERPASGALTLGMPVARAYRVRLDETRVGEIPIETRGRIPLRLNPGEVMSFEVVLGGRARGGPGKRLGHGRERK